MKIAAAGPILETRIYCTGKVVSEGATVTLPEIAPVQVDMPGVMGTLSRSVIGQFENMETTITKRGIDKELGNMTKMHPLKIEVRWAQQFLTPENKDISQGGVAFMTVEPQSIPGISLEPGAVSENEITYNVTAYRLVVNNVEIYNIDRLAGVFVVRGIDYMQSIEKFL